MHKVTEFKPAQLSITSQPYGELYSLPEALKYGTIFQIMNIPYILTIK